MARRHACNAVQYVPLPVFSYCIRYLHFQLQVLENAPLKVLSISCKNAHCLKTLHTFSKSVLLLPALQTCLLYRTQVLVFFLSFSIYLFVFHMAVSAFMDYGYINRLLQIKHIHPDSVQSAC